MVKAYLKYEAATSFGVVTSSTATAVALPSPGRAIMVACPAVDAVVIWNMRSSTESGRLSNRDTRRAGPVSALALAPNGVTLAVGYSDGSIRLWDVRSALEAKAAAAALVSTDIEGNEHETEPLMTFNGHRSAVSCLSFLLSPERQLLPADSALKTSETTQGSVDAGRSAKASPGALASAPPTRLVSGSNDGDVIAWDLVGEAGLFRLMAHNDAVTSLLMLERDQGTLIVCSSKDGLIRVYDADSQHCVQTIVGHHAEVWSLDVDPAHRVLITGSVDAELRMFGFKTPGGPGSRDPTSETSSTDDGLDSEAVLVDLGSVRRSHAAGRVVHLEIQRIEEQTFVCVAAADKSCELFRLRSGAEAEQHLKRRRQRRLEKAKRAAENGDDAENSRLDAAVGDDTQDAGDDSVVAKDYMVSIRSFKTGSRVRSVIFADSSLHGSTRDRQAHLASTTSRTCDVRVVLQLNNNSLEAHSIRVAAKRKKKPRKKQKYRGSVGEPGGTHAASAAYEDAAMDEGDEGLGVIERISAVEMPGHRGDVRAVALSPDDTSMLSVGGNSAKLWNLASGKCIRTVETSGRNVCARFLSADARFAAVGSMEGVLEIIDLSAGEVWSSLPDAHSDSIWSLALDRHVYDATCVLSGSADKLVKVWDYSGNPGSTGEATLQRTLELPDEVLDICIASGRDDPILVVALMDTTVRAFKMSTFEPYMSFYGHKMPVLSLDISSDGLLLATGSADKTVKLWGMDFGDCRRSLRAHEDSVQSVTFQPNTHYLFSGARDGVIKYWDCDKFAFISTLEGQSGHVWSICVGEDGEFVASGGRDRLLRVWRRTDEQMFLEEEEDQRMDEMFESTLIDEDNKEAQKARSKVVGFMSDPSKGEALPAGKRSLETVKAGEKLMEALRLAEAERHRVAEDGGDPPNPMLLGLSADEYVLRALELIRSPDLDEALSLLPLDQAGILLAYCGRLLDESFGRARLAVELLSRTVLFLFKLHHNQIVAGAVDRELVHRLKEALESSLSSLRDLFGFNASALSFWQQELADRDDAPFRDAAARAFNLHKAQERRRKRAKTNGSRKQ